MRQPPSHQLPTSQLASSQTEPLTVWLLSSYHTGSHQAWAEGYQRYSAHRVELITLAGRFWKWRMQGGAIELALQAQSRLKQDGADLQLPDVVLATDMVHLPVWAGLLRGELPGQTPLVCYMHENQLTYPWRPDEKPDLTYAMINWLSQLTADLVLFNSHYHLDSWFAELPKLLKHYPDYNHLELVQLVQARSAVAPVGITLDSGSSTESVKKDAPTEAPLILWNQRWEYDKRPDRFFELLYRLQAAEIPFRLAVAGENFRKAPPEFEEARSRLANQIVHWGYADTRAEYVKLLQQADLVISTADHEFFGISILEAVTAGAFPLLPMRLSYPELLPTALHSLCLYTDEDDLWHKAVQQLTAPLPASHAALQMLREHIRTTYSWPVAAQQMDTWLVNVAERQRCERITGIQT